MTTHRSDKTINLSSVGFSLAVVSIISALIIGIAAYKNSFNRIEKQYHEFYLREAKMLVRAMESLSKESDESVLRFLENLWQATEKKSADEYICVVDKESRLVMHTASPDTIGRYAGDNPLPGSAESNLKTLSDLVKFQRDYVGNYISSAGQGQLAAFVAIPDKNWIFGLHRSKTGYIEEIEAGLRSLEIGFITVCALLMPLSLILLYSTFNSAQKRQRIIENELRESEERYKNVVDSNLSAIMLYQQEEILFANKPFYDIFGYERGDLEKIVMDDLLAPEAVAEVAEKRRKRMAGEIEQASVYESKGKRKNGEPFDMEISVCASYYLGEPCCIASLSDISMRKKSEEAIRESESRFRTLFDLSPLPVAVVEMETGRLIDVNNKYCEMMQHDKTELIGRTTIELGLVDMKDRDRYLDRMKRTGETRDMEIDFTVKDGSVLHILVFSKHIRIYGEDLTVTVLFDVTERKWLESQLQQAHKMEAVGTLAGGIAHDFNNILGIIIGNTELAIDDVPEWNPARHNLNEVHKACIRARDVVRQILTFSRQAGPQLKPTKISPIITESLKLIRSSIPSTIEIRQNISNEFDTVNANPTQINQILLNLCANAAHAMEEKGGVLDVTLENVTFHEESVKPKPELSPGVYVKLSVRDTGHGIKPENLDRIFDPYFTTKEVGKGTGLGLAVAHAIVKNHGGVITVASKIDEGTEFQVFLPIYGIEVETDIETNKSLPKGNERILLVDDEKEIVATVRMLLERLGYDVTDSARSLDALENFRNDPEAYDLVITDMTMPHMTGDQLAKEILDLRPDIPVILCTGFSERINNQVAKDIGIRELLMKPIMLAELANTIRQVLDG